MPEMSGLFFVDYFRIRNGSFTDGTPVDDSGSFVNITFIVQAYKYFFYCLGAAFVHGKTFFGPVCGGTQLLQLIDNTSAVLFLPFPCTFQEFFTSQIGFFNPFGS